MGTARGQKINCNGARTFPGSEKNFLFVSLCVVPNRQECLLRYFRISSGDTRNSEASHDLAFASAVAARSYHGSSSNCLRCRLIDHMDYLAHLRSRPFDRSRDLASSEPRAKFGRSQCKQNSMRRRLQFWQLRAVTTRNACASSFATQSDVCSPFPRTAVRRSDYRIDCHGTDTKTIRQSPNDWLTSIPIF